MHWHWLIPLSVIVFMMAGSEFVTWLLLRRLMNPGCAGWAWGRAFPGARADIRRFLDIVCGCFVIPRRHRLRFPPTVTLNALYRAVEPPFFSMGTDFMEFENLEDEIRKHFGVDVADCDGSLTLGGLFAILKERNPGTAGDGLCASAVQDPVHPPDA